MGTSLVTLKGQVFAELGGAIPGSSITTSNAPAVAVELTDDQFNAAVQLATQWFTLRKGFVVYRPVTITDGISEYQMASDVQQVLDVIFQVPTDVAAFFSLGFFDLIPYGPQNIGSIGSGLTNYSGFAQLIMFNEQRKRVFSVTPEWSYDQQSQLLHIASRSGSATNMMLVCAKLNSFDPVNLNDKDDYIFCKYVRAKCKEIVGRVRSKYDSLPAAGGTTTMDGKDLIAEAKEEIEALDKEIFWSQGPDGMVLG
jgi:hypothetical protein